MSDLSQSKPRLALALGGGGVRGAAHLGVLRALEASNIEVDAIAGTSSGAIAAMLYALEKSNFIPRVEADTLVDMMGARSYSELNRLLVAREGTTGTRGNETLRDRWRALIGWERLLRTGMFTTSISTLEPVRQALEPVVGKYRFEDVKLPIACVTTDLINGERVILRSGALLESALASSAIPGVFPPVSINGRLLGDGHVVENVPVGAARELLDGAPGFVLAVDVGYDSPRSAPKTAIEMILRASAISRDHLRKESLRQADFVVSVGEVVPSGAFEIGRVPELAAAGYRLGLEIAAQIQLALSGERQRAQRRAQLWNGLVNGASSAWRRSGDTVSVGKA